MSSSYSLTIAGSLNFTGYDLNISGPVTFDGGDYTGNALLVSGTATFASGNLTTTVETAATTVGYGSPATIDWDSTGTLTPGASLQVGGARGGTFCQTAGTVDAAAAGCTLTFGASGGGTAADVYDLDGGTLETGSPVAYSTELTIEPRRRHARPDRRLCAAQRPVADLGHRHLDHRHRRQ